MKFCKQCGSPINARTKKCDSCGKQYFTFRNKWIISLFVFILLFSVSLFSNLVLFFSLKYAESENKGLHDELSDLSSLRDENNSLLTKNSSLSSANKNLSESNKEKNDEIQNKISENEEKIKEYKETLNNNQKASEVLNNELHEYEETIGLTDVTGEGVVLTLTDTGDQSYSYSNLVDFVNELKYAGATAISINDNRVINSTEIVEISKKYILLNGDQRISSPYTIKAIGDKKKLLETLNLKDEGYIDLYKNAGYDIKIEENDNITIYKYNKDIDLKYIDKGEDK